MLFTKNKKGDKNMVGLMDKTLKGLLATAIEKVCVLGQRTQRGFEKAKRYDRGNSSILELG